MSYLLWFALPSMVQKQKDFSTKAQGFVQQKQPVLLLVHPMRQKIATLKSFIVCRNNTGMTLHCTALLFALWILHSLILNTMSLTLMNIS
jgi:hypothetical protein